MTANDSRSYWSIIHQNEKLFWIDTASGYVGGGIRDPKFDPILLEPSVDDNTLGTAIVTSLRRSRLALSSGHLRDPYKVPAGLEIDENLNNDNVLRKYQSDVKAIVKKFRFKNKTELFNNMKYSSIICKCNMITISPTHHLRLDHWIGQRNGIKGSHFEKVIIPASSTPDEIGAATRLALSRCTG